MIKILIIVLVSAFSLFAQTEWQRWGKAEVSYKLSDPYRERDYSVEGNSGNMILKSLADAYWIFVSDVDGDNCPFQPTCSAFFVKSVKETNILQGVLMFADRFTRDMNIFDKGSHYPVASNGRFYDPPYLYKTVPGAIKFIPAGSVVDVE